MGLRKLLINLGKDIAGKKLEKHIDNPIHEKTAIGFLDTTGALVDVLTDKVKPNQPQVAEVLQELLPGNVSDGLSSLEEIFAPKIKNDTAKDAVGLLVIALQKVVEIYTDDNPDNTEQLEGLLIDLYPELKKFL